MSKVIGIDLGTTNSCAAVMQGGEPKILPTREGFATVPSMVAFTADGERLVGHIAKRQAITNPQNTFYGVKRLIGRRFDDAEVQLDKRLVPFKIIRAPNGDAWVEANGRSYPVPQISAEVLREVKDSAETQLGEPIKRAVVTVPAYFNDAQRQATTAAGRIAGLDVIGIINEPTAAALAFGLQLARTGRSRSTPRTAATPASASQTSQTPKRSWWSSLWSKAPEQALPNRARANRSAAEHTIAVFDLGGGTFDISILEIGYGVHEVKSTAGDTHLGGEDFDLRIFDYLRQEFKESTGCDLRELQALQRLREASEMAKIELSSQDEATISIPHICVNPQTQEPLHLASKLTRKILEGFFEDLAVRVRKICNDAMKDADLRTSDISDVLLVGGMTRMPLVQKWVEDIFDIQPRKDVNPDQAVALGAAIHAGVKTGDVKDILLLDVTPLSLGIETEGGIFTRIIQRNTTIPTKKAQVFSTVRDGQQIVGIKAYQGEREMSAENTLLGEFNLFGLPIAPRGVPKIEVTFDIDANGILHVFAKDKATGKQQSMRVQGTCGLSESEIQRLIDEAGVNKLRDLKLRSRAEAANEADALIYQLEKTLREDGEALPLAERNRISRLISDSNVVLQNGNTDAIREKNIQFSQALLSIGDLIYKAKAATADRHQLFLSYAREDTIWAERIKKSLAVISRTGSFSLWSDRLIETGSEWEDKLFRAVDKSSGAILLLSTNFLSSDFIMGRELPKLFAARDQRGLYLLPVVVTYCPFNFLKELGQVQTFNDPQKPLNSLSDWEIDKELTRLAEEIASRIGSLR